MENSLSQIGTAPILTIFGFLLVILVTNIITWCKLYAKAGQPGWTYLVPVYRFVVMARIAKKPEKFGWTTGALSAVSGLNHPVALVLFFAYVCGFLYILRDFIKQYDAPIIFWLYAVALPVIAVFQVDGVKYTATKSGQGPKIPKA